jgi:hypothetical protein
MRTTTRLAFVALAAGLGFARADVKVEEKTKIKLEGTAGAVLSVLGGDAAKDGAVQTVAVRGDRKRTLGDTGGEIVDLKEEKVYRLDPGKKTYEVVTFEELRKQFQKTQDDLKKSSGEKSDGTARESDVEVDLEVRKTGEKKTVNGFATEQALVTVTARKKGQTLEQGGGTVITQDLWLTKADTGRAEIAAFDRRYAEKIYGKDPAAAFQQLALVAATNPGIAPGLKKLAAEAGKIEGSPVLSSMRIESVKSAAEVAADRKSEEPSASEGLGGFLSKAIAKQVKPKSEPRATIMTSSTEVLSVAPSASEADVALPAGYEKR